MMTQVTPSSGLSQQGRHDRLLQEWEHDTYKSKHKLSEPTVCPGCAAIYREGRWQWGEVAGDANRESCPACQRIEDRVPAGFLTLGGTFLASHREEILHAIRNVEAKERQDHPLKRIMNTETTDDGMLITFTDPHLARGVGEALHRAYKGELDFAYQSEERILRVSWRRDD